MPDLFSVPAMFIMLRESIEACVVVALLLNMCTRLKLNRMRKQVWWGAAAGILVSILLGIAFVAVFYLTKSKVMTGASKAIFKGYINQVAILLITMLSFAMLRFMNYEKKWADKLEAAAAKIDVGRANQWSVFFLAFTAVFREGVESVIFLAGVSTTSSWTAIPLAGIVGVVIGLAVGFALYYTGRQIKDIAWFFVLSCTLLFFIAAGLTSLAMVRSFVFLCVFNGKGEREREIGRLLNEKKKEKKSPPHPILFSLSLSLSPSLSYSTNPTQPKQKKSKQVSWQSIGWFGTWDPPSDRPWWNMPVWDTSSCCPTSNPFFALMTAMFGYLPKPTFISLFSYFGYWAIVLFCIGVKVWRGTLTDATKGKKKEGGVEEEAEEGKGEKKPTATAAALSSSHADDSTLDSGSSEQDLPSAAPHLLPVVHKHMPHIGRGKAAAEEQPKAAAADVETGAAAAAAAASQQQAAAGSKRTKWWQRGKKE